MERFSFTPDVAFAPAEELLQRVTLAPLTMPVAAGSPVQAAVFRIASGGRISRHAASVPQILAVIEGSGTVSGASGDVETIGAGEAVFWGQGEEHETTSVEGMTVIVLEGAGLQAYRPPA